MGAFFDQVQLPDWSNINTLFSPDALQIRHNNALASDSLPAQAQENVLSAQLKNDAGSQDLTDRATLRDLAPGLASRNQNALATAASLPGVNGNTTVNALSTMDSQTAASKLAALQFTMGLPQMPGIGGTSAGSGGAPPASPTDNSGGTDPGGMAPGFIDKLGGRESGNNAAAVNSGGYSGKLQFGTGRMTDLGMYHPVQGENPNGNQWQGTITVPGFAPMTHEQFLQSPDAQRMAAEVHFTDIGQVIDNTPGAQDFNRTGLAAVAHLGGIQGMKDFVASGGKYTAHDHNGTSLQNYYNRFSAGGFPALQAAVGHPDGPLPGDHPARGVQVASTDATAGIPATATDASPVSGVGSNPAPGSTVPDTPDQLQTKLAQLRANVAGNATPVQQAAIDPAYAANMQEPTPGMGMPAPQAVAQARQELDAKLQGAPPDVYNAAISQRAMEIINQTRQAQGSPALTTPAAASPSPQAPVQVAGNAPRPVIPGSAITTTAPFADQRFPISEQGPSSQAVQQMPAGAQGAPAASAGSQVNSPTQPLPSQPLPAAATGAPAQSPAVRTSPAAGYDPMAGLPPGTRPIPTNAGTPYTANAPAGYAWALTPPTASNPKGQLVPYPLVPPVLKQEKTATEILNIDPRDGRIVSRTPITETGRMVFKETPQGSQGFMNGHAVGDPIPYSGRPEQNEAYKNDQKSVNGIIGIAQQAQTIAPRLNEMADLAKQLWTGPTAQSRGNAQAFLETLGVDPAAASRLTGMSSAAAFQEFSKLAMSTAGAAAKDDLGANNGVQALGMYMGSNPNPNLVQGTNVNITNMMRVLNQSKQDYAQAALDHFKTQEAGFLGSDGKGAKNYTPMTAFNQAWLAQNNPHVYAAAMGMLNGDPYTSWKARLADSSEGARAAAIVSRIDPNAMIPVDGGSIPVRQLLAKIPAKAAP